MNIYLVWQEVNSGYDTYSDMVVIASNEDEAKRISPCGFRIWSDIHDTWLFVYADGRREKEGNSVWADHIDQVQVSYIGIADKRFDEKQILCSSFHAG